MILRSFLLFSFLILSGYSIEPTPPSMPVMIQETNSASAQEDDEDSEDDDEEETLSPLAQQSHRPQVIQIPTKKPSLH